MTLSDLDLIEEACAINHARAKENTVSKYREHLSHFSDFLRSVRGKSCYTAARKDVTMFISHLAKHGGSKPHRERADCAWCHERGYPDGRSGTPGWSASTQKSYLSAIRFLYRHFLTEEDLPDLDPSAHLVSPRVQPKMGYTLTPEEVRQFLDAPGKPKDRLLAFWMTYAPSRRATFAEARWDDVDLDRRTWSVLGKGGKRDEFALHPELVREFRVYRRWQEGEARRNSHIAAALADPRMAYVLLTRNGRRTPPETVAKMVKWRATRAGIGVVPARGKWDVPGGKTSRVSPHALRRTWATTALNDPHDPVPIDVVAEVLNHRDISTTRRHYAHTKPERATKALRTRRY